MQNIPQLCGTLWRQNQIMPKRTPSLLAPVTQEGWAECGQGVQMETWKPFETCLCRSRCHQKKRRKELAVTICHSLSNMSTYTLLVSGFPKFWHREVTQWLFCYVQHPSILSSFASP